MSLRSEAFANGNQGTTASAPLLNRQSRRREVLRLQFDAFGLGASDSQGEPLEAAASAESRLREEVAALQAKLDLQSEAVSSQLEDAKRDAVESAQQQWERAAELRIEEERARALRICEEFREERARYFSEVEAEVVKLALAIAARVLHRETKLDPLLLTAAVRVALEKVAEQSDVVVRVPAEVAPGWCEALGERLGVQLVGDETLQAGECRLETKVGRVDLGVSAQLAEIERGFFDLLQKRPAR